MKIHIVAVGELKEKYWVNGIEEYVKRLRPYAKVQITEVPDEKAPDHLSAAEETQVKRKEGDKMLGALHPDDFVVALAINGQALSSEQFAERLQQLGTYGQSRVAFVIGGSLGLSDEVLKRAKLKLSFGQMTYPHQMMRLMLVEQVYRSFKIMRGEPYHK